MNAPLTATAIREAVIAGTLSAPAFLRERWQQLRRLNDGARDPAWISLAGEAQLEEQLAALAQRDPARCPLYGVPFAVKDNIDVAGWITTAACPEFAHVAQHTAHVVSVLQDAGAVLLGKTNLDQFATGLVGTRSPYGAVPNSFSAAHISGGSSSGSASVVARGLVAFALGTDTAGSGRVPAGFNNLVGVKPTPGIVSTDGVVPACRTLDCVSLLTLTAADAARVFAVMAGPGAPQPAEPAFSRPAQRQLALPPQPRVGTPRELPFLGGAYRRLFGDSICHLQALQCSHGEFDFAPFAEVAALLYQGPWTAERYAIAGRHIDSGAPGIDPVVAEVIGQGRNHSAVDAFNALYRVRELEALTRGVWDEFDVLMVPTAPLLPTFAEIAAAPVARNSELGSYTNFVNLLGLSALAAPFGFTEDGLPFGVTFIAPSGSDWALIEFAAQWQRSRALPLGAKLRPLQAADILIEVSPPGALPLAVVGAHLSGMPLHHQLTNIGARLRAATRTAATYRLHALKGAAPARPGLVRAAGGAAIEVEVYDVPAAAVGGFLAGIPQPLGLGRIELQDGSWVTGFICEPAALQDAEDITAYGGWRGYMAAGARRKSA
ncbi:MAG: allophanate hydrolase [Burkholderiales bacterium]|nr:allophanate hydrolase [Burkholderiales bacterium]